MEDANQGYTLFFLSDDVIFKHCGENCRTIVDKAPHFLVEVFSMLIHGCDEKYLVLLSVDGCFSSHLSPYTVIQVTVCVSIESISIAPGKPFAIVQLRTIEQQIFFAAYLSDDFFVIEPVYDFPPEGFACDLQESTFSQVLKNFLENREIFSISQLIVAAVEVDASIAKYFSITLGQSNTRYGYSIFNLILQLLYELFSLGHILNIY